MSAFHPFRRITALIALLGILFMQFAVVAYACPELVAPQHAAMAAMSMPDHASMTDQGCDSIDHAQPALCQAQSHAAPQSLDKPAAPDVQPFVPAVLVVTVTPAEPPLPASFVASRPPLLARVTAPSLAVRHCCFRI